MLTRLTPILPVRDVRAELTFYAQLGLERHVDPVESYPIQEFAAVTDGAGILFGLAADDTFAGPPAGLIWQLETTDIESVSRIAASSGLDVTQPLALQSWGRQTLTLRSPNGYLVTIEES